MAEINIDFLGVVISDGTQLQYEELMIERSQCVVDQLSEIIDNDGDTEIELQEAFLRYFHDKKDYNFCYPWQYDGWCFGNTSFGGGTFPKTISREQYEAKISKYRDAYERDSHIKYRNDYSRAVLYVERKLNEFRKKCKKDRCQTCLNYIYAFDYYRKLKEVVMEPSVKMYSTEPIGEYGRMSYMEYVVNEDMKFTVKTNFRYGRSSYFNLGMVYKGVEMLFYSDYIKYYYASQVSIMECTRKFIPKRANWPNVLRFVVEKSNQAALDPAQFIEGFVSNEIDEMMSGLRRLMYDKDYVTSLLKNMTSFADPDCTYVDLRYMNGTEKEHYKVHRKEMEIVFKMGKLSGAMAFFDSMVVFREYYPQVDTLIEEICQMNSLILPEIKVLIQCVYREINRLDDMIEELNAKHETLTHRLKLLLEELGEVDYSECPEYVHLGNEISENESMREKCLIDKDFQDSYRDRLNRCFDDITSAGIV